MSKLNDQDKLIALAHLHQGKSAKEVERIVESVSYPQALKLRRELKEAIEAGTLQELFSLEQAALDTLMEAVKEQLIEDGGDLLEGEIVDEVITNLATQVESNKLLETELCNAGRTLVKQINVMATTAKSPETIHDLADAIAKLQNAFFKTGNIQIANLSGGGFEEFLKK